VGRNYCIAHAETAGAGQDDEVFRFFRDDVKLWMADGGIRSPTPLPDGITWVTYDDDRLLVNSLCDFLQVRCPRQSVYIPRGAGRIVALARSMIECGGQPPCDVGIAVDRRRKFTKADVRRVKARGCLVLAQPDAAEREAVRFARERGLEVWRLDLSEALIAEVSRLFDFSKRLGEHSGRAVVHGVGVVAGGVVGTRGDLVVNSISAPTSVLGKADGTGGIEPLGEADEEARRKVIEWTLGVVAESRAGHLGGENGTLRLSRASRGEANHASRRG
jgi:hypothetical protein